MKVYSFLFLILFISFINCKNTSSNSEKETSPVTSVTPPEPEETKQPEPIKSTKKIPLPSQKDGVNYWEHNDCHQAIPSSSILKEHQINGYKFNLNPQQGYGKETMFMENGYKLDVTTKGCNSIVMTYSYFMEASELDISNPMAVSKKALELIEMTAQISNPPIDFKSKIAPLKMATEQIGPFEIGNEFILSEKGGTLKFSIERLEAKNNKVFLVYYFSKDQA